MSITEMLNIQKFNRLTEESYKSRFKSQDISYGNLFMSNLENKLSVIAKYTPPKSFVVLDRALNAVPAEIGEFYYGVSPKFDSSLIIKSISELKFSTKEALDLFISEHHNFYALHEDQGDYLPHIARYITLAAASNFGITFKYDSRLADILAALKYSSNTAAMAYDEKSKRKLITLKGCPTQDLLNAFNKYTYSLNENLWEICQDNNGSSIFDIYSEKANIKLINGDVFYSGVLLKPVQLSVLDDVFENAETKTLCFNFEKSTFATVFALDGNYLDHPMLCEDSKLSVIEIFKHDDRAKNELILKLRSTYGSESVIHINEYLKNTYNVNQIGVSANIITKDGVLLLGKRSSKSIDNGALYPGVNGNAEIEDAAVSFYHYSVYEDFPTIITGTPRLDFLGEISREAYAELKLDINKMDWTCLGVTISGNYPPSKKEDSENCEKEENKEEENTYNAPRRRLHFNVLFEAASNMEYAQTLKSSIKAEEKFENEKLLGIQINCRKNRFSKLVRSVGGFFGKIIDLKDFIEALLLLVTAFLGIYIAADSLKFEYADILPFCLAIIIIVIYIMKAVDWIHKTARLRKSVNKATVYTQSKIEAVTLAIDEIIKKFECHPVAYMLIKLHIYNKISDLENYSGSSK